MALVNTGALKLKKTLFIQRYQTFCYFL